MKKILFLFIFLFFSLTPSFSGALTPENIDYSYPVNQVVYVTKIGNKYHKNSCKYLKKSKIETTKTTAKRDGYTACSVCKP